MFSTKSLKFMGVALLNFFFFTESGTTVAMALFHGRKLLVAHIGDSKVVLCRAGQTVELTTDHNLQSQDELLRVEREVNSHMSNMIKLKTRFNAPISFFCFLSSLNVLD